MSNPLKITILDRTDTEDFQQLIVLLKKFTIETFVTNKPEYALLRGEEKDKVINSAMQEFETQTNFSILTPQDIKELKEEINSQISSAKKLIDEKINGNTETRYYVMKDEDRMVSFYQAQLIRVKGNNRTKGSRNLAFVAPEYRGIGKLGQVIDSRGVLQYGSYSKIIDKDIDHWFKENGVIYEKTCTGANMLQNILMYICQFGFLPYSKNDRNIFLEKFTERKIDRVTLKKVNELYRQHWQRTEQRNKEEVLGEIKNTPEFDNLSEKQIAGLVQCFLKENEKEFEIEMPDEKLQMLNSFIQEHLQNRRNSTNYNMLYNVSAMMARGLQITNRHFDEITTPSTQEQTIETALNFFQALDQELHEKVKGIIEGNSNIDFNMYRLDETEDFSKTKSDGMPIYTKMPCVFSKNRKSAIYLPCKGTIEDIYLLVHELSHTFDLIENDNPTRNILGEVTPQCFEAMLSQYLLENRIATRNDIINREKGTTISHYDDGAETFAKLELMKIKEYQGDIKQEDIHLIQKKHGITNRQLGYVLGRMSQSEHNVDYRARYMVAQLIYPYFMEQYKLSPQSALKSLKEYFKQVKSNNFEGSLETLGIQPNLDIVSKLIETCNGRINGLEQTILFSENEIGKATVGGPIQVKDKAKTRVQRDMQILQHEQESKIE